MRRREWQSFTTAGMGFASLQSIMSATAINRSVLVIDDDDSFRAALRELLEQRGLAVHTAGDAAEASRELAALPFDLIFTDLRMPGGGFSILDEVRRKGLRAPVIVVTGSSSLEWKTRAEAEGAFAYLTKPVGKEEILTVVRRAFERGRSPAELRAASPVSPREPMHAGNTR